MSYILEALRKSEQERQRGKVPDLNSFKDEVQPTEVRRNPWPWVAAGAVVVNLLVILVVWAPWQASEEPEASAQPSSTQPTLATQPNIAQQTSVSTATAPAVQPAVPPANQPLAAQQPMQHPASGVGAPTLAQMPPPAPAYQQQPVQQPQQYTQQPPQQPYGPPPTQYGAPPQGYPQQPGYAQAPPPQQQYQQQQYQSQFQAAYQQTYRARQPTVTIMPPEVQSQPTVISPNGTASTAGGEGEQYIEPYSPDFPASAESGRSPNVAYMPQLEELPPEERASIPDMTFSSHMYSSMPRFRSIIINGKRLKEGEYFNDSLQVREITDKGVIMSNGDSLFAVDVLGRWAQ